MYIFIFDFAPFCELHCFNTWGFFFSYFIIILHFMIKIYFSLLFPLTYIFSLFFVSDFAKTKYRNVPFQMLNPDISRLLFEWWWAPLPPWSCLVFSRYAIVVILWLQLLFAVWNSLNHTCMCGRVWSVGILENYTTRVVIQNIYWWVKERECH